MRIVEAGKEVTFAYWVTTETGLVVECALSGDAVTYTHGDGQINPEVERRLEGHKTWDAVRFQLPVEEIDAFPCNTHNNSSHRGRLMFLIHIMDVQ